MFCVFEEDDKEVIKDVNKRCEKGGKGLMKTLFGYFKLKLFPKVRIALTTMREIKIEGVFIIQFVCIVNKKK